jgi:signal transduction histidine kinase
LKISAESLFFLICSFFTLQGLSQVPQDLKYSYYDEMDKYIYVKPDSALYFSHKLLDLGLEYKDSLAIAEGYEAIGNSYYYKNDLERTLQYYHKATPIYKSLKKNDFLGVIYMSYGNVYSDLGQFANCLTYFQKSEHLLLNYSEYNDDLALLYYNMSHVFMEINDDNNLEKYIAKAKKYAVDSEFQVIEVALLNIEAHLNIKKNRLDEALTLSNKALRLSRQENDLIEVVFAYQNLASIYTKQQNWVEGIAYQDSALAVAKSYGDKFMILAQKSKLADYHIDAGNLIVADSLAETSFIIGEALNSLIVTKNTSKVYARVLEQKGEYKKALEIYNLYQRTMDSIRGFDLSEKILLSENLLSESQNKILKSEARVLKLSNQQNKLLVWAVTIGLILALLVIFLLFKILQSRKKAVEALNEKQLLIDQKSKELGLKNDELQKLNTAKDKLFSILTHDLRQPFNQISSFIQILEHTPEIDESLQDLISEIKNSTNHTLVAMNNLLAWSKSQFVKIKTEPESVPVKPLVEGILLEMTAAINEKSLHVNAEYDDEVAVYADRNHIEIIVRNLLSNAAKFSPVGGNLSISARKVVNEVEFTFTDEGKGMTQKEIDSLFNTENHFSTPGTLNEKGSGLGMLIVNEFVQENKGTIKVSSMKNIGSTFKVILPAVV